MSIILRLTFYLEAKAEYEAAHKELDGSYSPHVQNLYDRMSDAENAFDRALDNLIANRIESATGARP